MTYFHSPVGLYTFSWNWPTSPSKVARWLCEQASIKLKTSSRPWTDSRKSPLSIMGILSWLKVWQLSGIWLGNIGILFQINGNNCQVFTTRLIFHDLGILPKARLKLVWTNTWPGNMQTPEYLAPHIFFTNTLFLLWLNHPQTKLNWAN